MKLKILLSLFLLASVVLHAQDDKALEKKVKEISKGACECIAKIDIYLEEEEKNEEIKSCIMAGIMEDQVNNTLLKQLQQIKDTLEKTKDLKKIDSLNIGGGDKNITIIVDENYDEIEEYLLRNCTAIKQLLMTSDTKHKNSLSDKEKALEYYNEGIKYYKAGEFENAVVAYRKAVKKDKKFAFAWDNLGICYRKLGNYKQAIKAYKKSLKLDPKGRVPLMNLPIAQEFLKEYDNAIESYEKFSKIYPDDPEAYYGVGRIYILKKDYENALDNVMKAYKMYVELNSPYNKDAQQLITALYIEMKKNDQLDAFNKIAKKHNIDINIKE